MGAQGYEVQGVWVTWAMGYGEYGAYGQCFPLGGYGYRGMGHGGMGHGGMGYKGYGPCGQRDTEVWAMGPMSDLLPKYQKDVKLSKRCQVVKKMSNVKKSNT